MNKEYVEDSISLLAQVSKRIDIKIFACKLSDISLQQSHFLTTVTFVHSNRLQLSHCIHQLEFGIYLSRSPS